MLIFKFSNFQIKMFTTLVIIIILALIFDYINGFHDAANSIANIVSTKVLVPISSSNLGSFFNFAAFFLAEYVFHSFGIGDSISKIVTNPHFINLEVILSRYIGSYNLEFNYLVVWHSIKLISHINWWFYGCCNCMC